MDPERGSGSSTDSDRALLLITDATHARSFDGDTMHRKHHPKR
jgi:hypothetical protein